MNAERQWRQQSIGIEQAFVEEIPHCRQPWGSIIERFSEIEWTLQDAVDAALQSLRHQIVFLIDRVDEGYEPDDAGVALVDALVLAAIDVNTRIDSARVT